ncbi:Telomerase Protein Component 1 [Manis pentadactyla]|nr:Telomerase Protein Component 1 [Manis pentadactyla]
MVVNFVKISRTLESDEIPFTFSKEHSADPDSVALVNFRGSSFQSSEEQETRETEGPEYLSPGKGVGRMEVRKKGLQSLLFLPNENVLAPDWLQLA